MDVRNCLKCKKVFTYFNSPFCPDCVKEEETVFERVRAYIKENNACTMADVVEATGVSIKKITRYLKEGRIEISKGMEGQGVLDCELCGKEITKGKFCDSCAVKISQDMNVLFESPKKKSGAQIHMRKQ